MKPELLLCLALVLGGHGFAAIVYPKAPEEGRQIAFEKVVEVLRAFPMAYKGIKIEDLTITNSHQMYSVGPADIVSGKLLSAAKFTGWRYLFIHGTNAVCEVPLGFSPKNGKLSKRGGVSEGRILESTMEALRKVEELPQIKQADYECRYLTMAMSFHAVWLHGKVDDIIIPLPPTFGSGNAYQPYSESEMIKLLKPEAENRLKQPPGLPD